jgi:hypothetical protein
MKKNLLLSAFFGTLFFSGCYYDNIEDLYPKNPLDTLIGGSNCDTASAISYANDIQPILSDRCGTNSCHSSSPSSGIDLSTHDKVAAISVKNADGSSVLYSVINWDNKASGSQMPKGSTTKIDDCSMAKIRLWINAGAPNN